MQCPHCNVNIHIDLNKKKIGVDNIGIWFILDGMCPACSMIIIYLELNEVEPPTDKSVYGQMVPVDTILAYPRVSNIKVPHPSVPKDLKKDFMEASLVLNDSPKASAALSRRCLQSILREQGNVNKGSLNKEIDQAMASLPSYIGDAIDAIRQIGNFAAHPIKSDSTGEIVEVEAGEAQWNLDVLELLFDFYYVQPSILKEKQEALNKKLADIGKPPMKTSI